MVTESWVVAGPQIIEVEQVDSLRVQLVGGRVDVVVHDDPTETGARIEVHSVSGKPLEVSLARSDGMLEYYLGEINGPRVDLASDAIVRGAGAKDYGSASRMYGLVDGHLLWAWDIAALGQSIATHASGRLARVD